MSDDRAPAALTWLAYALGDLDATRSRRGDPQRPRIVGFNAQQAVEKALKAAIILEGQEPPGTHDLDELRNLLRGSWSVRQSHPQLVGLSGFAVEARYPADMTPVTPIQSATAVRQAMAIVRGIREDFERHGVPTADLEPR
jgi:HEPN domain-containing protein